MNVFLLMIALACHADAPKVDLHEVLAATAAAPKVSYAAKVADVGKAVASATTLPEVGLEKAAEPTAGTVGEVVGAKPVAFDRPVELNEVRTEPKTTAGNMGEVQPAKADKDCCLVELYSRRRILSAPWSVARRLEAARILGDTEEEERLTELLEEVVGEALKAEEEN